MYKGINRFVIAFLIVCFSFTYFSCQKKDEPPAEESAEEAVELKEVKAVCIYDNLRLLDIPTYQGSKTAGHLSRGEIVTWTGEEEVDTKTTEGPDANSTFYKVRVSTGQEAWARGDFIIPQARPAAITGETPVYERDNKLSKSKDKTAKPLVPTNVVAVLEEKGDWAHIIGSSKDRKWWIPKEYLSYDEVDVAVGVLSYRIENMGGTENKINEIKLILEDDAFRKSAFINLLQQKLIELEPPPGMEEEESIKMTPEYPPDDIGMEMAPGEGDIIIE